MIQPEDLYSATEHVLCNLKADESLKHRIIEKSVSSNVNKSRSSFKPVAVFCGILGLFLVMISVINSIQPLSDPGGISMFTAGNQTSKDISEKQILNMDILSDNDILSFCFSDEQIIDDRQKCAILVRLLEEANSVDDMINAPVDTLSIKKADGTESLFMVSVPYLSANGKTWECAAFFDEIQKMTK